MNTSADFMKNVLASSTESVFGVAPAENWQDLANCLGVDPDLFFPERGASTREAKEVCRGCVVRGDCLEYALANGEKFGIWGGMSERERRRIRRQRALARLAAAAESETARAFSTSRPQALSIDFSHPTAPPFALFSLP